MFTGIIESIGILSNARHSGGGKRLTIDTGISLENSRIGDSIAVNGACLTVVEHDGRRFSADVSPETLSKTTLGKIKTGQRLNIERAMRLSDRLDGHLVSGHIDGTGTIRTVTKKGNAIIVTVDVPSDLGKQMITKGSVALDGTSLTINDCSPDYFQVAIIPHTTKETIIEDYRQGTMVNIETDMIGKYVAHFTRFGKNKGSPHESRKTHSNIDMDLLGSSGFLRSR